MLHGRRCAVAGRLWCWGKNNNLGLGFADGLDRRLPTQVGSATNWATVSMSNLHTCATRTDGTLWCWGDNSAGALGDGSPENTLRQTLGRVGTANDWSFVSAGWFHSCAIKSDRSLWCWGMNGLGEVGDGTTTNRLTPVRVGSGSDWLTVSSGQYQTCGLRSGGTLWCWGGNDEGQLGIGSVEPGSLTSTMGVHPSPNQVGAGSVWTAVAAGENTTCAVRTDQTLWCWGANRHGELADASAQSNVGSPVRLPSSGWQSVGVGQVHVCALKTDRTIWCWGDNFTGQLGDGTNDPRSVPAAVPGTTWTSVSARSNTTCGTRADGSAWCWGTAVGDGTLIDRSSPTRVGTATGWSSISVGLVGACGAQGGAAWCWGWNFVGDIDSPLNTWLTPHRMSV